MSYIEKHFSKHVYHNNLLEDDDKILVAVSGGIDSLTLSKLLSKFHNSDNFSINIEAAFVNDYPHKFDRKQVNKLKNTLNDWNIDLTVLEGNTSSTADMNCYKCSKKRRKLLFEYYVDNDFTGIAFGHHEDDYIETGFMNLIKHGSLESLKRVDYMFDGKIRVIRPLLSIIKKDILDYARENNYSEIANENCPIGEESKRIEIQKIISEIEENNPEIRPNLCTAIKEYNSK